MLKLKYLILSLHYTCTSKATTKTLVLNSRELHLISTTVENGTASVLTGQYKHRMERLSNQNHSA